MSDFVTTLIPTNKIYELYEVLQGRLSIENVKIRVGGSLGSNFNPDCLKEVKNIPVKIESISFRKESFSFLFIVKINTSKYKIREIGVFYSLNNRDDLIAYRSGENILNFDINYRARLELVLPHSQWNENIDTNPAVNFSSDIYREISDSTEDISDFFSDNLEPKQSPTEENLNFSWSEVVKNEMPFPEDISLVALDRHPKKNILLFLYKKKKDKKFYFTTYNIIKQNLKNPIFAASVKTETSERYGVFGKIDDDYIRCYQSHPSGVFCIRLSISKNKAKKSHVTQQYHSAYVKDDTTLFKLGNNAALSGGSYTGFFWEAWDKGNGISASGVFNEAFQCLVPTQIIDDNTSNPISKYIDDDDEGEINIIGGLREPDSIKEEQIIEKITEEVTKEEITEEVTKEEITKEVTKEEITEEVTKEEITKEVTKEEITEEVTKEKITEEEITEEEITEKEITEKEITGEVKEKVTTEQIEKILNLYPKKTKKPKYIFIKNKGVYKKIKVKTLPIQKIYVNNEKIKKEKFTYFSTLNPRYKSSEILKFESVADYNDFLDINSLKHILCQVENKFYIFSRKIFSDENEAKFFVYNRDNSSISTYFFPEEVRKLVIRSEMSHYTDVHVVVYNKIIYFVLHLYLKYKEKISTQIIKLEVS